MHACTHDTKQTAQYAWEILLFRDHELAYFKLYANPWFQTWEQLSPCLDQYAVYNGMDYSIH
jgi:hypothetical protein